MTLQGFCQEIKIFQTIDSVKDKSKILKFIKEFGSCTDSVRIQKYIEFPYFIARHKCDPMTADYLSFYTYVGTDTTYLKKIKEMHMNMTECSCHNPLYSFSIKAINNENLRDSLVANKIGIPNYYFSFRKNKDDYCQWLISTYHFPLSFENIDTTKIPTFTQAYPYGNTNEATSIDVRGYGFADIVVVKINGEYKIVYVGYLWN